MIIDASVWVSSLVASDIHFSESRVWLAEQERRGESFVIPTLTLPEVAGAISRRTRLVELGRQAAEMIARISGIRFVSLDRSLAQ